MPPIRRWGNNTLPSCCIIRHSQGMRQGVVPLADANPVQARIAVLAHLDHRRRCGYWVMPHALSALPVTKSHILAVPFVTRGATVGRPSNEPDRLGSWSGLALRPCCVARAIHATVIAHEAGIEIAPMITRTSATALLPPARSRWCSRHPANAIQYPAMLSKGIGRKRSKKCKVGND